MEHYDSIFAVLWQKVIESSIRKNMTQAQYMLQNYLDKNICILYRSLCYSTLVEVPYLC